MSRIVRLLLLALLLSVGLAGARPAAAGQRAAVQAQAVPKARCEADGRQSSGAIYRICMPSLSPWNGDLVIFAHGYVPAYEPVGIPEDQLSRDGVSVPDVVTALGYAFATTSYSVNGLAVKQGLADLVDLVSVFKVGHAAPRRVYLLGFSEGGLITTLAMERYASVFSGGLAACGPIGDFRRQINHIGDFRVVFDYFFPGLIPGDPANIPASLVASWDQHFQTVVRPALEDPANAGKVRQLLQVTGAAIDQTYPAASALQTIYMVLGYNIFGTMDLIAKVGGQPYDNQGRVYAGSDNDAALNAGARRYSASGAALAEIAANYETTGRLSAPLVTMHTTGDPLIPIWHQPVYASKVEAQGSAPWYHMLDVGRYGHCTFQLGELQAGFQLVERMVKDPPQVAPGFADEAVSRVWARTDRPVLEGRATRSWVWGPKLNGGRWEPYNGGWRLVQYFDKSRMEINDPRGDRGSQWFVTNGLLVQELIDGRLQVGDGAFEQRAPSDEVLAGDPRAGNPNVPGYAALRPHLERVEDRSGAAVVTQLLRDGAVSSIDAPAVVRNSTYIPETGHNIPGVLWDFMNQSGQVWNGSDYGNGQIVDWLFAFGYPITDAFWIRAQVGGVEKWILVQAFQRRVLTYTPDNAPEWRVEMGNVGQHYLAWRY